MACTLLSSAESETASELKNFPPRLNFMTVILSSEINQSCQSGRVNGSVCVLRVLIPGGLCTIMMYFNCNRVT